MILTRLPIYNMKHINCEKYIEMFLKDRDVKDRYASFDYCFNYFQGFKNKKDIVSFENIEKSCLHLWFYLASRWMYRGSSFLLQTSMKVYEDLLNVIVKMDSEIRKMDVDKYPWKERLIIDCYNQIKNSLIKNDERDIVLITKIMLGLFWCIPAFDEYFSKWFKNIINGNCGFTKVNEKSLWLINEFYIKNQKVIDRYANKTETLHFDKKKTNILYTKAKIIDMILFTYGLKNWWSAT